MSTTSRLLRATDLLLSARHRKGSKIAFRGDELEELRSAIDQVDFGLVLLDETFRAQFINTSFHTIWRLPNEKAQIKPMFAQLVQHGRETNAYAVPTNKLDAFVRTRIELVERADPSPLDLQLSNGSVIRFRCIALPDGGRILNYVNVTDLIKDSVISRRLDAPTPIPKSGNNHIFNSLIPALAEQYQIEQQHLFAVKAAEIGTWTWNLTTDEILWSERYRELIGAPHRVPASRAIFLDCVHPADRYSVEENFRQCLAAQDQYDIEFRIIGLDARLRRWLNSKGRLERDQRGRPVRMQGVLQDITARKEVEHDRDDLRRRLMGAQELERARLARELHDQTGQSLIAIMLELKGLEPLINEDGRGRLRLLRKQLDEMGKTLHHVSWELRPPSITELGLTTALTNYISEWRAQCGIEADFDCRDAKLDELSDDIQTSIYRTIQEGLNNIVKHAVEATLVSVVIDRTTTEIRLMIEDNGCGFDPAPAIKRDHKRVDGIGLAGMRERLALIGGSLQIESTVGVGTALFARIPIGHEG